MESFELLKIISSLIFFSKASIDDIKTTEIKDFDVYFFVGVLIFLNILEFLFLKDWNFITSLVINASIFGIFGLIMYVSGQWGLGDSFLLFSFGLLNLFNTPMEALGFLILILMVGVIFIFIYSVLFTISTRKFSKLKSISKISMLVSVASLILFFYFARFVADPISLVLFLAFLYFSLPFLSDVKNLMIKKVKISELKEGDVLLDFKVWRGITKEEIEELKRRKVKYVFIKEGVRYAPTFLFSLILLIFEKLFGITVLYFFVF